MTSDKPALEARGLLRTFGSGETLATAVQDVSLSLFPGEISLLMGPSGSGKSTLLALLSGLLRPDAGEVECLGKQLVSMSEKELQDFRLKNFGYIFQGYNLFPALTALQQLEIVLRWGEGQSKRAAHKRAETILTTLGLGKKAAPTAGTDVRRRKTACGDWPGAGEGAQVLLCRRAHERPGLGARRTGDRVTQVGGP